MASTPADQTQFEPSMRGSTVVEYALLIAVFVGASLLAVGGLTGTSGSYLSSTGQDIGEPRVRTGDMNPDLPDPPAWIP